MNFLWAILLILSLQSHAQDFDVSYLQTQNTIGSPFSIPVRVNQNGEFQILKTNNLLSLGFTGQFSMNRERVEYILPRRQDTFSFEEQEKSLGWFEIKRFRIEYGLGLEALMASGAVSLGLTPYKGAYQVITREKASQTEAVGKIRLPKELTELNDWGLGTQGSFQTYGGIQAVIGAGFTYFTILNYTYVLQNLFQVELKKLTNEKMVLTIGEESLKRRKLITGAAIGNASVSFNDGKLFRTHFILEINNPEHQELYKKALGGEMTALHLSLPQTSQNIEWYGKEAAYYVGVPFAFGKTIRHGHYTVEENGAEQVLDIDINRNNGVMLPLRNHKKLVYQDDEKILLFWASEMKSTHRPALERNFLSYGKAMGLQGFDSQIPQDVKFGSTVTHLAIAFTKEEIESMEFLDVNIFTEHLRTKCIAERLRCKSPSVLSKMVKEFVNALVLPWEELRHDLGKSLIKRPELVYAIVRTLKLDKKVYFKFLSDKFQSIEGTASIDLAI